VFFFSVDVRVVFWNLRNIGFFFCSSLTFTLLLMRTKNQEKRVAFCSEFQFMSSLTLYEYTGRVQPDRVKSQRHSPSLAVPDIGVNAELLVPEF
jgi:hypothetical protein